MPTDADKGRLVAGLWCTEVLAGLADYVDGELSDAEVAAVRDHLDGCDWCERFGGAYSSVVGQLQRDARTQRNASAERDVPDITASLLGRIARS